MTKFLVLLLFAAYVSNSSSQCLNEDRQLGIHRIKYCDKNKPLQPECKVECCENEEEKFLENFQYGGNYYTTYMSTLKYWNCSQYYEECRKPIFKKMNKFTNTINLLFCNKTAYEQECATEMQEVIAKYENESLPNEQIFLELSDLLKPCVAAKVFESVGIGRYFEVATPNVPFVDELVWFGMDIENAQKFKISPWTVMPVKAKIGIGIGITFLVLLSISIIFANGSILIVMAHNRKIINSQYSYKTSIACADFMVGAFVMPSFINNQIKTLITPRNLGEKTTADFYPNTSFMQANLSKNKPLYMDGGSDVSMLGDYYMVVAGVFLTIALFVSVSTLFAASVDRLIAIAKSMSYNKRKALKASRIVCGVLWIIAIVVSILPNFQYYYYMLYASIVITSAGVDSLILTVILVPFIGVWVVTIATFIVAHSKLSIKNNNKLSKNERKEIQLAKILALMVGVFTICLLPVFLDIIVNRALGGKVLFAHPKAVEVEAAIKFTGYEYVVMILLMSNSLWNFLIYSARDKKFLFHMKTEFKIMFYKLQRKEIDFPRVYKSSQAQSTPVHKTRKTTSSNNASSSDGNIY